MKVAGGGGGGLIKTVGLSTGLAVVYVKVTVQFERCFG